MLKYQVPNSTKMDGAIYIPFFFLLHVSISFEENSRLYNSFISDNQNNSQSNVHFYRILRLLFLCAYSNCMI